jgi:hypothetical protein
MPVSRFESCDDPQCVLIVFNLQGQAGEVEFVIDISVIDDAERNRGSP